MSVYQIFQGIIAAAASGSGGGGGGGGGGGYRSWTIEWWSRKQSPQPGTHPRIFSMGYDANALIGYSNESGGDYVWTNTELGLGPMTVGSTVNTWIHWAIVSDGTNLTFYKNGQQLAQSARNGGPIVTTDIMYLGSDGYSSWKGMISDFHVIKGAAKYTSNFTPPSTRIQAQAETVLLMPLEDSTASVGPNPDNANSPGGAFGNGDPYGGLNSFVLSGTTQGMYWTSNSIFALDAA
jgi:hypothetical protein